jgi:hypothetical protein
MNGVPVIGKVTAGTLQLGNTQLARGIVALSTSRYVGFPILLLNGVGIVPPTQNVTIPTDPSDGYHIVTADEIRALDLISFREYGVEDYWYVLAYANGILDPIAQPQTAQTLLRVPTLGRALTVLKVGLALTSPTPSSNY